MSRMALATGTYNLGPGDGRLAVRTGKGGAVSVVGHNLLIEVGAWEATIEAGEATSMTLTADSRSLRVLEGSGGPKSLDDDDRASIAQSIDEEVLKGGTIAFRSTSVAGTGGGLHVEGELDLLGEVRPVAFDLALGDGGAMSGATTVKQSDWGMKPFSTLFGTLKVADDVKVEFEATLPTPS